jgi:hypothetical protein
MALINETSEWKRLEEHSNVLKQSQYHLRALLQDSSRSDALTAEHSDILLDFSRQNLLPETMVSTYGQDGVVDFSRLLTTGHALRLGKRDWFRGKEKQHGKRIAHQRN